MPIKKVSQNSNLAKLDRAITQKYPSLNLKDAKYAREEIIAYITEGLEDGYDIALIKPVNDDEISLKVLKLGDKKNDKKKEK